LGADSLDRLKLATALGEAIHLARAGLSDSLLARPTLGEWTETAARSLAQFDAELTFRTSGSSGEPKWCVHALAELEAEIDVFAPLFADRRRILAAVPSHHIYGFLFTILLAVRLGLPVVDVRPVSPAGLAALLLSDDLVVGHPAFWAGFARAVPGLVGGIRGTTSTAPCPPELSRALAAAGLSELVEIYGSSETAGLGWRTDPAAPYELLPYWRRGPSERELIRRERAGTERLVTVPDRLSWHDERHVVPVGREDVAVQVGGYNVFPERVRDVLVEHPAVADAAVRLMRPDEGDRLKAFIVPRDVAADAVDLRAELQQWLGGRLAAAERPRAFAFGRVLPTGPLGKLVDWPAGDPD
jgi:4-coumarate--CoA ligase (photoactive yellow protein activation family)